MLFPSRAGLSKIIPNIHYAQISNNKIIFIKIIKCQQIGFCMASFSIDPILTTHLFLFLLFIFYFLFFLSDILK
jgi:hypothetical protein